MVGDMGENVLLAQKYINSHIFAYAFKILHFLIINSQKTEKTYLIECYLFYITPLIRPIVY